MDKQIGNNGPMFYRNWVLSLPNKRKRYIIEQLPRKPFLEFNTKIRVSFFKYFSEKELKGMYNKIYKIKKEKVTYMDFNTKSLSFGDFDKLRNAIKGHITNDFLNFLLILGIRNELNLQLDDFECFTKSIVGLDNEYDKVTEKLNKYIRPELSQIIQGYGDTCSNCKKFILGKN